MLFLMFVVSWAVMEFVVRRDGPVRAVTPPERPLPTSMAQDTQAPVATGGLLALGRALERDGRGQLPAVQPSVESPAIVSSDRRL